MSDDDHVLFRGRIITLTQQEVVLPNGVAVELEIVHHPGGAVGTAGRQARSARAAGGDGPAGT